MTTAPFLTLLLLAPVTVQNAPAARNAAPASVEALSWMAGHWVGPGTEDVSEEVWLPPAAGNMTGMWRWATKGQMRLMELLAIAAEGDRVVLRLKHFRPDLHGLEEKDAPFVLPAIEAGARSVVFQGQGTQGLLRITYRAPTPDTLEAVVERGGRRDTFVYSRKPAR